MKKTMMMPVLLASILAGALCFAEEPAATSNAADASQSQVNQAAPVTPSKKVAKKNGHKKHMAKADKKGMKNSSETTSSPASK